MKIIFFALILSVAQAQPAKVSVTEAPNSPEYRNAILKLKSPKLSRELEPGKTKFTFAVANYDLGKQTPDAMQQHCANSAKGQHIHFIVDNGPYAAYYDPVVEQDLAPGKHLLLAFLSRSYHESIKNKKAFILKQLTVGDESSGKNFNLKAPYLFYSRPKGEYVGDDTKKLLLDFYLVNTKISKKGNKVKATVNGQEFILTKWVPYIIEGLPMGENKIRLQLIDKKGNPVPGPFNDSGERTITLKEK